MNDKEKQILRSLIQAALPFLSEHVVDVTSGTAPLMARLENTIDEAAKLLDEDPANPRQKYDPAWSKGK